MFEWELEVWKNSRMIAFKLIDNILLDDKQNINKNKQYYYIYKNSENPTSLYPINAFYPTHRFILLDDTMHLKSMRKLLINIAKKCTC